VLSSRGTSSPSRARRWWIAIVAAAIAVAGGSVAYRRVLPGLVGSRVERMLAAHGFPGAHVGATRLGFHHLRLEDVALGDGLAIGAIEIDAGVSLLWRTRIHQITLRDAMLSARRFDRLAPSVVPSVGGPASELPFDVVRIERGTVMLGEVRAAVSGTIAEEAHAISVDLQATSERVALGELEIDEVRASLQSAGADAGQLRACITGRVAGGIDATAWACGTVPATPGDLRALRTVDATFAATAPGWQLRGTGTLGWASTPRISEAVSRGVGTPTARPAGRGAAPVGSITGGHVTLTAPVVRAAPLALHGARISTDIAGSLAGGELRLEVDGVVEVDRVEFAGHAVTAISRAVRVPLAGSAVIAGGVTRVTPRQPVLATARDAQVRVGNVAVELASLSLAAYPAGQPLALGRALAAPRALTWSASAARLGTARFRAPSGTLVASRMLRWRAAAAEWHGAGFRAPSGVVALEASHASSAAWESVTGPGPLALGAGEVDFHHAGGRLTIDRGHASALGGELAIDPFLWPTSGEQAPAALLVHARGLELHRVLAAFAHGHADGDGILDGELALRIDGAGTTFERGALHSRAMGGLRLNDAAWRARASASAAGFALHQRIAATLCDFEYSRLAAVLRPVGADPELQITTRGRGKRVAQDLDLVINLRGVRDAAQHLPFAQPLRSQP
jgi:hypothetical protein